jgi:DNA repair protein RadC
LKIANAGIGFAGAKASPSMTFVGYRPLHRRLACTGPELLSDAELLACALGRSDATDLARLLEELGGLSRIERAGVAELAGHGLSPNTALRIKAAFAIGRRVVDAPIERGNAILGPEDVEARLRGRLVGLEREELHVLGLDSMNRLLHHFVAGVGAMNQVYASPRDVYRPLIREGALGVIVVHNHPSGSTQPSPSDHELTIQLREAGRLVGIPLFDHVVLARDGRYSFAEAGALGL